MAGAMYAHAYLLFNPFGIASNRGHPFARIQRKAILGEESASLFFQKRVAGCGRFGKSRVACFDARLCIFNGLLQSSRHRR